MAEALPFVGAIIGSFFGMPQVGWMIGSALYYAVSPAPTISAGDPSVAPNVGSNIRSQTVPVHVGTVRAPGYIIWQNNFNAEKSTRRVGSGKKKSKQEYYAYSWDFIYHMGFTFEPYRILGMWEGSERIQDISLAAITFADGNTFQPGYHGEAENTAATQNGGIFLPVGGLLFGSILSGILEEGQQQQADSLFGGKQLEWTEAYFYGGYRTSTTTSGWSYFQTTANAPSVRWPGTVWIGFRALDLGEQPRVPGLNFEIGPVSSNNVSTFYNDTAVTLERSPASSSAIRRPMGVTGSGRFALWDLQVVPPTNDGIFEITDTLTGAVIRTFERSDMLALFPEWPDIGIAGSHCAHIPGTNEIVFITVEIDSGTIYHWALFVEINEETGEVVRVGYSRNNYGGSSIYFAELYCVGYDQYQQQLLCVGNSAGGTGVTRLVNFSNPRRYGDNDQIVHPGQSISWSAELGSRLFYQIMTYANLSSTLAGFICPIGGSSSRFYFYVNKARCQWALDNPGTANAYILAQAATYPDGFMAYVQFTNSIGTVDIGPTICHGDFNGALGPPWEDWDQINSDGSAAADGDCSVSEHIGFGPTNWTQQYTDYVVAFEKDMSDVTNTPTRGAMHDFRVFTIEPWITREFSGGYGIEQELEDVPTKYLVPEAQRFSQDMRDEFIGYAFIVGDIMRMGLRGNTQNFVSRVGRVRPIDYTPPEIINMIWTDTVIGFGKDASTVDSASYAAAIAYCEERGIYLSLSWLTSQERTSIFELLCNIYGGWVAWTGRVLKFGTPQEVLTPVMTIDIDCIEAENEDTPKAPLSGKRMALQDTTNKVTVRFQDRQLAYRPNEVTLADEVDQDLSGTRYKAIDTGGVMAKTTAYLLAERMLWGNLYARNIYPDVLLGWKCAKLEPGDIVTLYEPEADINAVARLVKREEVARGKFKATFIEELDYLGKSKPLFETPRPGARAIPTAALPPLDFNAYELPSQFQSSVPVYYVGWAPSAPSAGAGLYTSTSTTDFTLRTSVLPFPDSGRLITYMPPNALTMTNVQVLVNARSSNPSSMSPYFAGTIPDFNSNDRAQGASAMWIGSEMIAYEGATLVGSNIYQLDTVYRGFGGTYVHAHSRGDPFWLHAHAEDGDGIFAIQYGTNNIGTSFFYKVVPIGFDGVEVSPSSVAYKQYTITGQHFTPAGLDGSALRVLVGSDTVAPTSLANQYGPIEGTSLSYVNPYFQRFVGSSEQRNVVVMWPEVAKESGFGAYGFGSQGYGQFDPDVRTVSYDVHVVGSGGLTVYSTTVTTPNFFFDAVSNAAANGAWRGNIAVSVHPRNSYGLAPFAAVVSLQLDGT